MGQVKKFIFKVTFCQFFFCNTLLTKFLLKLPSDLNCSIHVFYKGKFQSLAKNTFTIAKEHFSLTLIIIIS